MIVYFDPNVRVGANYTFVGFEDFDNSDPTTLRVGDSVTLSEPEGGLYGEGIVSEIDMEYHLVFFAVEWDKLQTAHV